ncbi:MAG: class I SAM-dependent methyltransferase, partial [Pseudomonadota bacterium]
MADIAPQGPSLNDLERLLIHFVFETYLGDKWRGDDVPKDLFRSFAAHAEHLSDSFTLERREFRPGYLRLREYRSAYLLYFHLASLVRALSVFRELRVRGLWPKKPLRVLDVGCGSAPSVWAAALACESFGGSLESVEGWDRETGILADSKRLFEKFAKTLPTPVPRLRTRKVDLRMSRDWERSTDRFDLIIVSNVLNELDELGEGRMGAVLCGLLDRVLERDGKLVVIEPALLRVSRKLT